MHEHLSDPISAHPVRSPPRPISSYRVVHASTIASNLPALGALDVAALQRAAGNQAVQRLMFRHERSAPQRVLHRNELRIQRWDSREHVRIGEQAGGTATGFFVPACLNRELAQHSQTMNSWPADWQQRYQAGSAEQRRFLRQGLTYGEVIALSGDFYEDFSALNNAPLREIFDLIPMIRNEATTSQLQAATGGRYLALAAKNESHFTNVRPGHSNLDTWRSMRITAIQAARIGDANTAWGMNAAADHFLTDAFSGGHLRVERSRLMASTMGNIESKVLHDLDNHHGVDVINGRGDTWTAYGDEHYGMSANARNRELAEEAVQLSKKDIQDALSRRMSYPEPNASTRYPVETIVPRPVDPSRDRWTGRTPSYAPGPPGTSVRQADDYTQMRDKVVAHEAPGVMAGFVVDDDQIRDWLNRQDMGAIGRQSVGEKIRMIDTLIGGVFSVVTDDDMRAIERICQSVTNAAEMAQIRAAIDLLRFSDLGDRARFRVYVRRL